MTTPAENQNWQKRQYDSFGPHFRIETANPELGAAGNIAYNLYGYSDSKDVSNLGMMGDGQFQIFADQCITIAGGANVDGGGLCINIVGTRGDVAISAEGEGDIRIKGRNIFLDAEENIRVTAICPSWVNTKMAEKVSSIEKSKMTQPEDIAEICSTILKLPIQSVPFEIALNCNYEI